MSYSNEDDKELFWDHLVREHSMPCDSEALVLVSCIDAAFVGMPRGDSDDMVVDHELVQYMAGWMRDSLNGHDHKNNHVVGHDANHFLKRAFNAFYLTVIRACQNNHKCVSERENGIYFGCLELCPNQVQRWRQTSVDKAKAMQDLMKETL